VLTPEMETINFNLDDPELDVAASYVPEIASQHERAVQKLREGRKGILLLHGSPGTGKTTYIRHLTKEVYEKDFIFISSDLAPQIANPEFTRFLMNNVGCILVIEDAEQVMRKRVSGKNTAVSVLLNLGDGLMSDILGVQFVCTFNCELDEIDPALTRKGRLLGNMEFKPLSPEQATALATKIGKPFTYTTPTTVAEIYNREG
jgi:SpoVK/Ycf46/Vps4 family AAA+-type ATPase